MNTNHDAAKGFDAPGGDAKIETLQATIAFAGSQGMGDARPGRFIFWPARSRRVCSKTSSASTTGFPSPTRRRRSCRRDVRWLHVGWRL